MSDNSPVRTSFFSRLRLSAFGQMNKDTTDLPDGVSITINEALSHEGKAPEGLLKDTQYLSALYKGYKHAYDILNIEVGNLRAYSAPYIRPEEAVKNTEGKPGIFLVTLPKSATVYVANSIASSLDYTLTNTLVTPMFPKNVVWSAMMYDFMRGGMVSVSHMQPDRTNLAVIKKAGLRKGVIHIRDPRAALLSWVHFIHKRKVVNSYAISKFVNPAMTEFSKLDFETRVSVCISNFFMHCVEWITGWVEEADRDESMNYLIVYHDELVADEEAYFAKIMDFYGIDAKVKTVKRDEATHFSKGDNSEWREVLTPAQIATMNEAIPDWMWDRFGWEK
ncbi:MAG: sulfotransferase domain-containing protein [Parvibaculaceae bacterium]